MADYVAQVLADDDKLSPSRWSGPEEHAPPAVEDAAHGTFHEEEPSFTFVYYGAFLFASLILYKVATARYARWKQDRYQLNLRRRHGIPDEDKRPFDIAYRQAAHARRERELQEKRLAEERQREQVSEATSTAWKLYGEELGAVSRQPTILTPKVEPSVYSQLRPRSYQTTGGTTAPNVFRVRDAPPLARDAAMPASSADEGAKENWTDRYNPPGLVPPRIPNLSNTRRRPPRHQDDGARAPAASRQSRKRLVLESEGDDDDSSVPGRQASRNAKKSRIDGAERIDGDNEATFDLPAAPKRRKRGASAESDDDELELARGTARGKRARQFSLLPNGSPVDEVMSDDEPPATESKTSVATDGLTSDTDNVTRGRKRVRSEAGSMYGGVGDELDDDAALRRRARKRGRADKPRVAEEEVEMADGEESEREEEARAGDEDMHDGEEEEEEQELVSTDPLCQGRRVGEVWEVNGQQFKVGPDGYRLRFTPIRQHRRKFIMPKDSLHSDANAQIDVITEKWLTEAEFKAARARGELAWQDPLPTSSNTPSARGSPAPSTISFPSTGTIQSVLGPDPFDKVIAPTHGRRLSSVHSHPTNILTPRNVLPDAPATPSARSTTKSFSKWEKQKIEAEGIVKMRAKQQAKEKSKTPTAPPVITIAPPTPAADTTTSAAVPDPKKTVRFVEPDKAGSAATPSASATTGSAPTFAFPTKAPTSTEPATAAAPTPAATTPATATPAGAAFSFPSTAPTSSSAAPKPAFTFPTGPATATPAAATTSTPAPSFSFPSSTQTAAASTTTPAATNAPKPAFTFPTTMPAITSSPAAAATPLSEAPKPAFSFPKLPAPAEASKAPSTSTPGSGFSFGPKPAGAETQASAAPTATSTSAFTFPSSTPAAPAASAFTALSSGKSPFSVTSSSTPGSNAAPSTSTSSPFSLTTPGTTSFGFPPKPTPTAPSTNAFSAPGSTGLTPFAKPPATAFTPVTNPTTTTTGTTPASGGFPFGVKPAEAAPAPAPAPIPAATTSFKFGPSASAATTAPAAASGSTFSFNSGATSTAASTTAPTPATPTNPTGVTTPHFSMGTSTPTNNDTSGSGSRPRRGLPRRDVTGGAQAAAAAASTTSNPAGAFKFSTTSTGAPATAAFGTTAPSAFATSNKDSAPAPVFGTSNPSPFGAPGSAFGTGTTGFGASAPKPGQATNPFGAPANPFAAGASAFGAPAQASAAAPTGLSILGAATKETTPQPASGTPAPTFQFGAHK